MAASIEDLEMLYRQRYRVFVRVASAVAGNEGGGADAVQDAFARAVARRATFRGDGPLEAWVWRIVLNAAHSLRPAHTYYELPDEPPGAITYPEPDADEIDDWIRALPDRQRLVVFLRYFADLDYQAIATILGIQVGTVSAALHAAHSTLRKSLEEARYR